MKKNIILFTLIILSVNQMLAQHCDPNTTEPTVDIWDWRDPANYVYYIDGDDDPPNHWTPFKFEAGTKQANVDFLQESTDKDYYVEDGWELIRKDFGTPTSKVAVPSLIMYNKYESKLRVFFLFKRESDEFNGALIRFYFGKVQANNPALVGEVYQSGLLEYTSPPANALDNQTMTIEVEVPNEYKAGAYTWLHADIPVAYDPCTCEFPSQIVIEPALIKVSEINLNLEGKGSIAQILDNVSANPDPNREFKAAIHKMNDVASKGVKVYKYLSGFKKTVDDMQAVLDLKTGTLKVNKVQKKVPVIKFPPWAKALPYVGEAVALLDLFMGGGKTTSTPKPMRFETELSFNATGYEKLEKGFAPTVFATPGADKTGYDEGILPIYDNVLGHFNVITTPSILKHREIYDDGTTGILKLAYRHTFKVENDLDYVINPASEFYDEPHEIKASIVVHGIKEDHLVNTPGLILSYYEDEGLTRPVYRTPYLPLGCLKNYAFAIKDKKVSTDRETTSIQMYLSVKVVLKRAGTDQDAVFVGKYNISERTSSTAISPNNLTEIEETVDLDNITLTNDMTVYAWDAINVGNNIITNGNKLHLIAGNSIDIPSGNLLPNVEMEIGGPAGCERKILPVKGEELSSFCRNRNKYNPVIERRSPVSSPTTPLVMEDINLEAKPNPFNDFITLNYTLPEEVNLTLIIYNMMGQEVATLFSDELKGEGKHEVRFNGVDLTAGMYFATIQSDNFRKTIKIIKQ